MTRQELSVFFQEWFCGCGSPEMAAETLRMVLSMHPLYEHGAEFDALVPCEGLRMLLLYTLDHFELTEHGGTVGGGWLTDKGKAVLAALEREKSDNYAALFAQACIHGYAVEGEAFECPECRS